MHEWWESLEPKVKWGSISGVIIFLFLIVFLVTRETKEEKAEQAYKENFQVLLTYEEDLLQPVLEEDKSIDELVEELIKEQLGVGGTPTAHKEHGVRETFGVFVETSIYEGEEIPILPPISKTDIALLKDNTNEQYILELHEKIMNRKEESLSSLRATQENDQELLLKELQERLKSQSK